MARTQDELSEDRLLSWLRSMRRDHGLDWRFVEGIFLAFYHLSFNIL